MRFLRGAAGRDDESEIRPVLPCRPRRTEARRAPAEPQHVPPAASGSASSSAREQFIADDCMGLAQQVAFSSLLAFFPTVILLSACSACSDGVFDSLERLPRPGRAARRDPADRHRAQGRGRRRPARRSRSSSACSARSGRRAARWARSSRRSTAPTTGSRRRPFWKVRLIALVLVVADRARHRRACSC